jgi:hypothetical protein
VAGDQLRDASARMMAPSDQEIREILTRPLDDVADGRRGKRWRASRSR